MRRRDPGRICDGLWLLGRTESCVYWLESGDDAMIVSGGLSYIVPEVMRGIAEFGLDEERLSKILILHSHFDHVGIIPFFKRRNPQITLYGSGRAWEILSTAKFLDTINGFGRAVADRMDMSGVYDEFDLDWSTEITGDVVSDGGAVTVGDLRLEIVATPGHSSCSISAYSPDLKALFPSDGVGIPYSDMLVISGNSNFTEYQRSLERLAPLETDLICADHYGYVDGEEARRFVADSIDRTHAERAMMEEVYRRTGDIDVAAKEISDAFFAVGSDYFLEPTIYEGVCRQMVRHLAKALDDKESA